MAILNIRNGTQRTAPYMIDLFDRREIHPKNAKRPHIPGIGSMCRSINWHLRYAQIKSVKCFVIMHLFYDEVTAMSSGDSISIHKSWQLRSFLTSYKLPGARPGSL